MVGLKLIHVNAKEASLNFHYLVKNSWYIKYDNPHYDILLWLA